MDAATVPRLDLFERLTGTRWGYELAGRGRRPMQFHADGRVGEGAEAYETYWGIDGGRPILLDDRREPMLRLEPAADGAWAGRWLRHERTEVRLVPLGLVRRSPEPPALWFCTACMGRLANLRETLPHNLRVADPFAPRVRLLVLDYGCPDGTAAWVRRHHADALADGRLDLRRTAEPTCFRTSHAKNVAHRAAGDGVLSNLDADNLLDGDYIRYLLECFRRDDGRVVVTCTGEGLGGRVTMRRACFESLGGYDEAMRGWGYEDSDLVERARRAGGSVTGYRGRRDFIPNSPAEKTARHPEGARDLRETYRRNEAMSREHVRRGVVDPNGMRGVEWGRAVLE
jgi:hypothetical protein